MNTISIPAHFDGERILLDEPFELEPNTKLIVTVLPKRDAEHESWQRVSVKRLEYAYSEDEEGYPSNISATLDRINKINMIIFSSCISFTLNP